MSAIHVYYKTPLYSTASTICTFGNCNSILVRGFWGKWSLLHDKANLQGQVQGQVLLRHCDCRTVALCLPSTAVSTMVLVSKGHTLTSLLMQWTILWHQSDSYFALHFLFSGHVPFCRYQIFSGSQSCLGCPALPHCFSHDSSHSMSQAKEW